MKNDTDKKLPVELSPFELLIIVIIERRYKVTMKQFLKQLPRKETCVKRHVKRLVDTGIILKRGKGKNTWYEGAG